MRKPILILALLAASAVLAQSQFRQRIRHVEGHYDAWLRDDGGVVTEFTCLADTEVELVDGGMWPLKVRVAFADGGMPNPVLNTCARQLEARNGLDGGFQ